MFIRHFLEYENEKSSGTSDRAYHWLKFDIFGVFMYSNTCNTLICFHNLQFFIFFTKNHFVIMCSFHKIEIHVPEVVSLSYSKKCRMDIEFWYIGKF